MNSRKLMAAGLAALCLSSAACASVPAKGNIAIEPRKARINLQKRIDEFMANRDLVNVYMLADNGNKDAPLYNGPAENLPRLERMLLYSRVFLIISSNGSPFASVVLSDEYKDTKLEINYEAGGEQLKLQLNDADLSGLADSLR